MNTQSPASPEINKAHQRALKLFAIVFVVFSLAFTVFKRTDWFPWVGKCHPSTQSDHFLAYCHSVRYGDYEHFAYYHESEPEAVAHVKSADVVFLGSSNTQFAFSTDAVNSFFDELSVKHYVLGFGHGAQSGVALAVAEKLKLRPKIWIVNADPFFTGEVNATFQRVHDQETLAEPWNFLPGWLRAGIHGEHARKRWLQLEQSERCTQDSENSFWCQGGADTLHRNSINGHWAVEHYRSNLQLPVGADDTRYTDTLDEHLTVAKSFIQKLGIDGRCLIFTATPRSDTPVEFAEQLANRLGSPFIYPTVDSLKTIDGFHLDPVSAERWSTNFLLKLAPLLRTCL